MTLVHHLRSLLPMSSTHSRPFSAFHTLFTKETPGKSPSGLNWQRCPCKMPSLTVDHKWSFGGSLAAKTLHTRRCLCTGYSRPKDWVDLQRWRRPAHFGCTCHEEAHSNRRFCRKCLSRSSRYLSQTSWIWGWPPWWTSIGACSGQNLDCERSKAR